MFDRDIPYNLNSRGAIDTRETALCILCQSIKKKLAGVDTAAFEQTIESVAIPITRLIIDHALKLQQDLISDETLNDGVKPLLDPVHLTLFSVKETDESIIDIFRLHNLGCNIKYVEVQDRRALFNSSQMCQRPLYNSVFHILANSETGASWKDAKANPWYSVTNFTPKKRKAESIAKLAGVISLLSRKTLVPYSGNINMNTKSNDSTCFDLAFFPRPSDDALPLHVACRSGFKEIIEELYSAPDRDRELVKKCVNQPCRLPRVVNRYESTSSPFSVEDAPVKIARFSGHPAIVELLLNLGAEKEQGVDEECLKVQQPLGKVWNVPSATSTTVSGDAEEKSIPWMNWGAESKQQKPSGLYKI
jgi:hypothetical protein